MYQQQHLAKKTDTTITVKAKATDTNNDKLTYTLYAGTSKTSLNKASQAATGSSGSEVELTVRDLASYTPYYWRVDVTDGLKTTTGTVSSSSVKTYCHATLCEEGKVEVVSPCPAVGCSSGVVSGTCSNCSGTGEVKLRSDYIALKAKSVISMTNTCPICGDKSREKVSGVLVTCAACGHETEVQTRDIGYFCICSLCLRTKFYGKTGIFGLHTECSASIMTSCELCGGTGEIEEACSTCNGLDYVIQRSGCAHGYDHPHWYCTAHDLTDTTEFHD